MRTSTYDKTGIFGISTEEEAREAGERWIDRSTRHEKLRFLQETCNPDFLQNQLVDEIVRWMGDDEFTEFYKHLCRNWDIKTPYELDYEMNS